MAVNINISQQKEELQKQQTNSILELRNITKTFLNGKIIANNNISLNFTRNEIHALVGENGSGKTTLMNIIFGLYKEDEGDILLNGKKVDMYSSGAARKYKIGMVHQHFHLVDEFSVLQNIILGQEQPEIESEYVERTLKIMQDAHKDYDELKAKNDYSLEIRKELDTLEVLLFKKKQFQVKLEEKVEQIVLDIKKEKNLFNKNKQLKLIELEDKLENVSTEEKKAKILPKINSLKLEDEPRIIDDLKLKRDKLIQEKDNLSEQIIQDNFTLNEKFRNNPKEAEVIQAKVDYLRAKTEVQSQLIIKKGIISYANARKRFDWICEQYNIELNPKVKVSTLPVGKRQMVEILKILWEPKDILVFDEPTATLSVNEIVALMKTIKALKKEGKTIIFISHKLQEVKEIADRVSILRKGILMGTHQNNKTLNLSMIAKEMIGKNIQLNYPKRTIVKKPIFKVENLTYETEKGFMAIRDINFEINEGEIFGLAGIEGNGQEEVIKIVTGLKAPTVGKIIFKDEILASASGFLKDFMPIRTRNKFISHIPIDRERHGMVSERDLNFNAIISTYETPEISSWWMSKKDLVAKEALALNASELSNLKQSYKQAKSANDLRAMKLIEKNIAVLKKKQISFIRHLPGKSLTIDYKSVDKITSTIIKEGNIDGAYENSIPIRNLSGGNQQKFVVQRELAKDHKLLVAGHPTRGLDISAIDHIYTSMIKNSFGKATLLYSLEINELMAVCDRMAIMYKGKIVDIIDPKQTSWDVVSKMMIGEI